MKRTSFMTLKVAVLSLGAVMVMAGCGDDDLTSPVVVIEGANPLIIDLGDTYTELGATATDEQDGDVSANILIDAGSVNTDKVDKYSVTYTVTDDAGNTTEETRQVWVRATADDYVGFFEVTENCVGGIAPYEISIEKVNETTLRVSNLGDFSAGASILDIDLSGDLNEVLTINDTDDTDPDTFVTADGSLTNGVSGAFTWNWEYTLTTGADSFTCDDVDVAQE